ncbi:armadillo-type protein [Baffinella frigidus]|nr:armadillo-type protein [Cryptophyta sp. CCMP2293]
MRDDTLLDQIATCIGKLAKTHPAGVLAHFNADHLQLYSGLVSSGITAHRRIGVCVFDEVIENLEEPGQGMMMQLLPHLVALVADPQPEVRQAAVYGLGVCAQFGGAVFAGAAPQVMQAIQQMMGAPDARSEANVMATDNAVSALGKAIEFHGASIDRVNAVQFFIQYLPVTGDAAEGLVVHKRLVLLLEAGEPVVFDSPEAMLPKILVIFAAVLDTETIDEEGTAKVKALMTRLNQDARLAGPTTAAFQALNAEGQGKMTALMAA